ncbi:transcriptional regulator Cro/C1 [Lactiplantibacillus plantarum]|uniref:helix-turn-helix domain-containing protein n=1 Tax=Lactiplantibacillus plantarum TaxID=1590 RepID=UPI0004DCC192|nr:helix-turn-helix transcriptional regulator [Lactiplantibacillus plantarum]KEZ14833.1 transcriptional regulator Cro/C1 [Lactiplantibacillus plantarum]
MTLFERVKEIAKKRGMSIAEVERKAGLSENYLYTWKKSANPRRSSIESVAKVLGVSSNFLLSNTGKPSTSIEPKQIDITDDDYIMTYQGKPIPPEDMEYIKRILNGGKD